MSIEEICAHSRKKPIYLLRLGSVEYESLQSTVKGISEFTVAVNHSALEGVKTPCVSLILAGDREDEVDLYVGVIKNKSAVTTLETRLSVRRVGSIELPPGEELVDQLESQRFKGLLQRRLNDQSRGVRLSPALSAEIVSALSKNKNNTHSLLRLSEQLKGKSRYFGISGLQKDAVYTALKIFGLGGDSVADALEVREDSRTVLSGIRIREDAVIEHDARSMPDQQFPAS